MASDLPPFWTLVEAHGGELLAHARQLAGQDAEDVVHEALLRALRAYPHLAHGRHLRAWLHRVTTTAALDARRRGSREVPAGGHADLPAPLHEDTAGDDFDALIAAQPAPRREALRLRFVEDLDYAEIAVRLHCSPATARQRVSAAVRALRKEMSP